MSNQVSGDSLSASRLLSVLASSVPVLSMGIAGQVDPTQGHSCIAADRYRVCSTLLSNANSRFRLLTRRGHSSRRTAQSKLVYDQLNVSQVSFVLNTFMSRSVRKLHPSRNPVRTLTSLTSSSAVHGPSVARCLTMRCLDNCSSNSFCVLVPDTTKSLKTDMSTALEWYGQSEKCPCRIPSLSWQSHSQHRSTVRRPSFHTCFVRTAKPLVPSSFSLGILITIVRRAGLWKCALLM